MNAVSLKANEGEARSSTGQERSALLLILEADLEERFPFVDQYLATAKEVIRLQNVIQRNSATMLLSRIGARDDVRDAYQAIRSVLGRYRVVFLSNAEGFIARNIIRWIHRDFPELLLIHLQHGMFNLTDRSRTRAIGGILNKAFELVADYSISGRGFIHEDVDAYVVYNNHYKRQLVEKGVNPERILISSRILKGERLVRAKRRDGRGNSRGLFLLQCLSALAVTSREDEAFLVDRVLRWLCNTHKEVLVKQHPYRDVELESLPENSRIATEDVIELSDSCDTAVSFFSEALFECEYMGMRSIAVRHPSIRVIPEVYGMFPEVMDILPDGSVSVNRVDRTFGAYYESEVSTPDEFWQAVGSAFRSAGL